MGQRNQRVKKKRNMGKHRKNYVMSTFVLEGSFGVWGYIEL
jgi:hypothetical protein